MFEKKLAGIYMFSKYLNCEGTIYIPPSPARLAVAHRELRGDNGAGVAVAGFDGITLPSAK
jgi:hypothetical protein